MNPHISENDLMSFEIIYQSESPGEIHWLYQNEAETMRQAGLAVRTEPSAAATRLLRRGLIVDEEDFPNDPRYIQNARCYADHCRIDRWYPAIADLTIPTVFCATLGNEAIALLKERGWTRSFVKNSVKSLVEECPLESVWPDVSFDLMQDKFEVNPRTGPYALRQYLAPEHFVDERRYWVVGGHVHHSSGRIPEIVLEAKSRLDGLGGVFYTIDATPALIVEINGGESSDRKTDNKAEDFVAWIKQAFSIE
jgi:hypothetical protein